MNLKGAKDYEFEEVNSIKDGEVYKLKFDTVLSSYDDGRKGFVDKKTGKQKEWIILKAKVAEEGFYETKVSKFINFYEDTEGLSDDDEKANNKTLKGISEFYERITGEEAPDELEPDDLIIALDGTEFASKVFVDKAWEIIDDNGKTLETQLTYGEAMKFIEGNATLEMIKVPKLTEYDGKEYKSYSFSPFVINIDDYESEHGKALETAPAESTDEPSTDAMPEEEKAPVNPNWETDI